MFQHYIFDLDGTLIDSAPAILDAFAATLAAAGLPPRRRLDDALIGPPLLATLEMISGVSDAARLAEMAADFRRRYDGELAAATPLYPGVLPALRGLAAQGSSLHIATNKRARPTGLILEASGIAGWFRSVHSLDTPPLPHRDKSAMLAALLAEQGIAAASACYVGDRHEDALAAAANQLTFLAAGWGYGAWDDPAACAAPVSAVLASTADLLR